MHSSNAEKLAACDVILAAFEANDLESVGPSTYVKLADQNGKQLAAVTSTYSFDDLEKLIYSYITFHTRREWRNYAGGSPVSWLIESIYVRDHRMGCIVKGTADEMMGGVDWNRWQDKRASLIDGWPEEQ